MKIAISGSTGFIGSHLITFLKDQKVEVCALKRESFLPERKSDLINLIATCDAVVNLAGQPINCRWTDKNKKGIKESRIQTTRCLVEAINEASHKPKVFLSTSAVGIYTEQEVWNEEEGEYDTSFLARVCKHWEAEAHKVSSHVRLVIPRLGVVLGRDGGAFPLMKLPFRFFVGGLIGSGDQGFSWIHINDLTAAFWMILNNEKAHEVIHCTAPQMCSNLLFSYTLAKTMHRPVMLKIPAFIFKLLYGEGHVVVTEGQRVFPHKLFHMGFDFQYPNLRSAIKELVN